MMDYGYHDAKTRETDAYENWLSARKRGASARKLNQLAKEVDEAVNERDRAECRLAQQSGR